ncbi:BTAD domain-containing putative transcriptional regulator [Phenylobacterium sp.]|uniref:BTAD domain-containing putative transcriptional regulator n=1 Tax=Phenylobacterium sp. TaxID=1871053 RepID=UPI002ED908D8
MAETARVVPLLRAGAQPHRVKVLGGFRVTAPDGSDATPRARKTRALLAFLLVTRKPWTRERLAALCWADRADEQAKASLRQALYELRDLASGPHPLLIVKRDEVEAASDGFELDVDRIVALASGGDVTGLTEALSRAQLDLLSDLEGAGGDFEEWLSWERRQTLETLLGVAVEAGETALADGRFAEIRKLADALEGVDGLNEPAVRLGLAADRGVGDLSALRRRFDRFARRLKEELDAEPAPETVALLQAPAHAGPVAEPDGQASERSTTVVAVTTRRRLWPWLIAGVAALLLALAGVWGWSRYLPAPASPSLAVLPFKAGDAREPYFGAGVSEAVLDLLGRDPELQVVGSATARQLGVDPVRAARRLGVDYLLQGETVAAGQRTDVTARLVRVRDGRVIWSRRYQRPADDIFAVQNELAAAVAERLGARIAPRPNPHLRTTPEVYDRYLQARSLARERRGQALLESRRLLLEAAALDPDFAPAFASLAQVTIFLSNHPSTYGVTPIVEAQAEARRYARRALELAPELGEAYAAYGLISVSDAQSLPFHQRAVALDPQRPDFHRWLAQAYSAVGREADALAEYQRAAALDPLMWLSIEHLVGQFSFMGREAEARAVVERFERISTDPFATARVQAKLAEQEGRLADFLRLAERAAQRWPGERTLTLSLAEAWALLGENERAARALLPGETIARLSLRGDLAGLAREARRLGSGFWHVEPGYWAFAEGLVRGGEGALLLQLFDAEFASVEDFNGRAPQKALAAGPVLIAALTDAGRTDEAGRLAAALARRLDADEKTGMTAAHVAYDRASVAALTGDKDRALDLLGLAARTNWIEMSWAPVRRLEDRVAFRSLRGDPRLATIQAELDSAVNRQRALLGLPPLPK